MASPSASIIPNNSDASKPFTAVHISNSIKLTPTNYLSWKMQIESIFIGHDLYGFLDGSISSPSQTIVTDNVAKSNPNYNFWVRQDKLLLGALVGTLSPNLVPLVSRATTTKEMWDILAQTYAKPSRGHIKQLKDQFNKITKGSRTITDYMQSLKACADNLASLGKPIEHEDLIDRVLDGLDSTYTSVIDAINGRDNTISFEELHENSSTKNSPFNSPTLRPISLPLHFLPLPGFTIVNLVPLGLLHLPSYPLPTPTPKIQPTHTVLF